LDVFCAVPFEAEAVLLESRWNRRHHADLPHMTTAELAAEERRVELRRERHFRGP
jgi:hypothetical protein